MYLRIRSFQHHLSSKAIHQVQLETAFSDDPIRPEPHVNLRVLSTRKAPAKDKIINTLFIS